MERENNYTPGNEAYDEETDGGKSDLSQGSAGRSRIVCPLLQLSDHWSKSGSKMCKIV